MQEHTRQGEWLFRPVREPPGGTDAHVRTDRPVSQRVSLRLNKNHRSVFRGALKTFIRCIREWERAGLHGKPEFPGALRVKKMAAYNCWEVTWAEDCRATWKFGYPDLPGVARVDWYRIGNHDIFNDPLARSRSGRERVLKAGSRGRLAHQGTRYQGRPADRPSSDDTCREGESRRH